MLPAFTTGDAFQVCKHGGFIAVCSPDGWMVWKGRTRIARGAEVGPDARRLALESMR